MNMSDSQAALNNFKQNHESLVAIDSDGCAFDSMEISIKSVSSRTSSSIGIFSRSQVCSFGREFVNLYSQWRGSTVSPR